MSTHDFVVESTNTEYQAFRFQMVKDAVRMPHGEVADRIYMKHPGAVAVVALNDDGQIALIHQYRHPVRQRLWEVPAGLRDVDGEPPHETAKRELGEEIDMIAGHMEFLFEIFATPGCSDESIRIYLADRLSPVSETDRHVRTAEEADIDLQWWNLDEAVKAVLSGGISNGITATAILAASTKIKMRQGS